jgi:hypothetical protein
LASYICSIRRQVTQADLLEDLPFYRGSEAQKREMMTLAMAHGYKNNMVIQKESIDGIEFYSGTSFAPTDLDNLRLAHSRHITEGYRDECPRFDQLGAFVTMEGRHWVNHHLTPANEGAGGYRDSEHCKPGFNLVVLDVDKGCTLKLAQHLLEDYTYLIHTTKSHSDLNHRFRIIMPISHVIELGEEEYKQFMRNVFDWLPISVDTQTGQRARKWMTAKGQHFYNHGKLLDALQFIPKTKKADEAFARLSEQGSLTALERWFVNQAEEGNRNNCLFRYAACLVDMGQDLDSIKNNVLALNNKLRVPLDETEVLSTVILSTSNLIAKKQKS